MSSRYSGYGTSRLEKSLPRSDSCLRQQCNSSCLILESYKPSNLLVSFWSALRVGEGERGKRQELYNGTCLLESKDISSAR